MDLKHVELILRGMMTGTLQSAVIIVAQHMNMSKDLFKSSTPSLVHWKSKVDFSFRTCSDDFANLKAFRMWSKTDVVGRSEHCQQPR